MNHDPRSKPHRALPRRQTLRWLLSGLLLLTAGLSTPLVRADGAAVLALYVSTTGVKGAPGSRGAPLGSIQEALDRARPGTTVHLLPGVYRERVQFAQGGKVNAPVTLEGEDGVILDGSDDIPLRWQPAPDIARGVYKAPVGPVKDIRVVTLDGKIVTLLAEQYVDPDAVKQTLAKGGDPTAKARGAVTRDNTFTPDWAWPILMNKGVPPVKHSGAAGSGGWDGVKALAIHSKKRQELILRIQGDVDPRTRKVTVSFKAACVTIKGADYCVVRHVGMRYSWKGVQIERSVGSVVEDCRIQATDHGVWLDAGADRCTVRFNEISFDPYAGASPYMKGWWENWMANKTGGFYDRVGIEMHGTVGGHAVHDNFIHDGWDGIEDVGKADENVGLDVHHNRIVRCIDDGLEPNGGEADARWHDNYVEETACGFRIKSPSKGPLYAYRNIFLNNVEDYRCFVPPQDPVKVYIYHNTSTSPSGITYLAVHGIGTPEYYVFNNLFWCEQWFSGSAIDPNWHGDANVIVRRGSRPNWATARALAAKVGIDRQSLWVDSGAPGLANVEAKDLSLRPDSPARGRGADLTKLLGIPLPGCEGGYFKGPSPDAGAVQFGQPMPTLPRPRNSVTVPPAGSWPSEK